MENSKENTPRGPVTPPFVGEYTDEKVSDTEEKNLCVAECNGTAIFEFTGISVTDKPNSTSSNKVAVTFRLLINGAQHGEKTVKASEGDVNFNFTGDRGTNIITVISNDGTAYFSGTITQTTPIRP